METLAQTIAALDEFLAGRLPEAWSAAVASGEPGAVERVRVELDAADFVRELGEAGWVMPHWAVEHGGRGLATEAARAVMDRLADWGVPRLPTGSGTQLAAPAILEWAGDDTKRRFLPRIASGEERWCQLFSEPGAGSDLASLATTAERDGDEWIVNGQKVWTTLAQDAEFGMLLARTDADVVKHRGITYFGVDMNSPGVEIRPLVNIAGEHEFNEVFLTDVRIPDLYRISPIGEGWSAAQTTLSAERFTLSGTRQRRTRSDNGILGGKTLDEVIALARAHGADADPVIRARIAALWTRQQVLRWTIARTRSGGAAGSITKVLKAETNQAVQEL
ncbi:MAG: acyl-CoA dehydrogenase, partial [Ilumatobacteraceae bacterium]|nr:acyl-CoA dehydrogenase [Ilumatobacteraceae bacterium]